MDFFRQASRWASRKGRDSIALVTVVDAQGSVPRHVGTRMLVDGEGELCQTIGGGRVEAEVTQLAVDIARGALEPQVVTHHLVRDLAMCCGGSMTFQIVRLRSGVDVSAIATALADRRAVEISSDFGGLGFDEATAAASATWDGVAFRQVVWPRERAVLFGAGHVARALIPILASADFEIVVCDDNELGALDKVATSVDVTVPSFEVFDVERSIGQLGEADFAIVLTRDHAIDQRLVEKLLANERLGYVGLIGSQGKVGRFRKRLFAKEVVTEESWARLSAPIGLDIRAETPGEIAISIGAELVARRAQLRRGGS